MTHGILEGWEGIPMRGTGLHMNAQININRYDAGKDLLLQRAEDLQSFVFGRAGQKGGLGEGWSHLY